MFFRKLSTYLILIIGSLCTIIGMAFSAMYINGAIVSRWGEADQSLLFWHLPILFLGVFLFTVGLAMSMWGINRFKSDNSC